MILLTLAVLGIGIADLVRWSDENVGQMRVVVAAVSGVASIVVIAVLCGSTATEVLMLTGAATLAISIWLVLSERHEARRGAFYPLAWFGLVVVVSIGCSGLADPVGGPLEDWFEDLPAPFVARIPLEQFMLAVATLVFITASANRLVRLVLAASGTPPESGEAQLKGGRVLGILERLIVYVLVLAGEPAGAALIIAGKGLVRLPEIHHGTAAGVRDVTEYFLIGTLASITVAGLLGLAVLAYGL